MTSFMLFMGVVSKKYDDKFPLYEVEQMFLDVYIENLQSIIKRC